MACLALVEKLLFLFRVSSLDVGFSTRKVVLGFRGYGFTSSFESSSRVGSIVEGEERETEVSFVFHRIDFLSK